MLICAEAKPASPITTIAGNTLPLLDLQMQLSPQAARIVTAFMFFADDPVTAWAYIEAQERATDGPPEHLSEESPRVLRWCEHAIRDSLRQAQVATMIGHHMLATSFSGEEVSFRKAVYLVQSEIDGSRTLSNKKFPRDEKNLRDCFRRFLPSVHLLLATCVPSAEPDFTATESSLRLFLSAAATIQVVFGASGAISNWRPWVIDPRLILDDHFLEIDGLSDAARSFAKSYRAVPNR
jgi:hypothetical protein